MYEIDKPRFGRFIAELRREKGFTQKELAERLYISDKAVSKWETGTSIPDTALLIPLAELLGVSVTELLMCRRLEQAETMEQAQVEDVVQTALRFRDDGVRAYRKKSVWQPAYAAALALCAAELWFLYRSGFQSSALVFPILGAVFGAYFCLFAKDRLPEIYERMPISLYSDGIFRMNIPGVRFNNRNWPHILRASRIWCVVMMALFPLLDYAAAKTLFARRPSAELCVVLLIGLGGLFLPVVILGKKYE